MKTWTIQTRLDSTGRLHLDIPIAEGPEDVEVLLVVARRDAGVRPAEWTAVDARLGGLAMTEDPTQWQRRIRHEWTD